MALADDLKPIIDEIRGIPGSLGLRPNRVYLVRAVWSGEHTGELDETQDLTEITVGDSQPPKVKIISDEQKALGQLADGSIEIGPITPTYTGGGIAVSSLYARSLNRGETLHVKVVGPAGTNYYRITEVMTDRAMHYKFRAEPVQAAPVDL
jgi:hypothetical protein